MVAEDVVRSRDHLYNTPFVDRAFISQELKRTLRFAENRMFRNLSVEEKEALDMICHKLARIVSGTEEMRKDSWIDIAGYAQLAVEALKERERVRQLTA